MTLVLLHDCDVCGASEERVWTDSFTGMEVCQQCLHPAIGQITNSPHSERDNIKDLLNVDEDEE